MAEPSTPPDLSKRVVLVVRSTPVGGSTVEVQLPPETSNFVLCEAFMAYAQALLMDGLCTPKMLEIVLAGAVKRSTGLKHGITGSDA